ncbi:MAG: hypothetical protein NTW26_10060 [bacterium]|nr:hypothetical protein [bacterium]
MRKPLFCVLMALLILTVAGCRKAGPNPDAYTDREPLPQFKVHMRATGGWDYQDMKYVEWTIEYSGRGDISYEYLSENDLGHMEQKEAQLPAWMGYALWDDLEKNDVWELVSDESVSMEGHSTYVIELRLGDRRNEFNIYAPDFHRDKRYQHVVKAIQDFY